MNIIKVKDQDLGGKEAFNIIATAIKNGAKVLGLATGSSPITMYNEMTNSDIDFSNMTSVNLDEYVGLKADNDQSYHYFMNEHLFSKKPFKNSYVPDGSNPDAAAATSEYDKIIADNPIDVQVLGIGRNGHIGFNEPGSPLDGKTSKVALTESTIEANKRFFDDEKDVPRYAYSMGIGSIMKAKKIILVAYGENKADAIAKTVNGPVTEDVPASALQNHPDVTLILDDAAASKL
ncbi:glucosamine-6-phosphate deaminase [Companilactobacillus nodensis]|uniref:Glucosamine-6-phosphate deaminase n=1 Tax=Companilactobacillus nodensis DSM 19682 = JCM 14932 = NBRC 107160 TaxID=1423775 RepID=A0A0R1KJ21_9LACO|nr:glucosamine-6-phosphate deaminase [Companilactobacillus nodensis]KRK81044.1 glucosamine-6-phosphate isomerase [Companilactobacillus nodensis DSM 19682 = JCM 14932 = NBRC 107160]